MRLVEQSQHQAAIESIRLLVAEHLPLHQYRNGRSSQIPPSLLI